MAECRVLSPRWLQGFGGGPVGFVDHTTLCFASGCFVRFVDTQSHKWFFFKGPETGINTLASSVKSNRFAIADCGLHPTIRVFSYPHFQCSAILKGGAELEISFLSFSYTGPYLASFSGLPDFSLCVWDWMNCTLLCCHSLHGVNLLGLTFNPSNWKQLFTIGDRHMSIWSVEQSDNVYLLRSRPVSLPSEDGKEVIDEDVVLPGRHDTMLGLSVPNLPVSARAGLIGEVAKRFVPRNFSKQLLRPCSFCWTSASQLFVGCREGHLLQIDCNGDSFTISPLFPGPPGSEETLQPGHVNALALQKLGLFAGGTDGKLHQLIIQSSEVKVHVCGDVGSSISSLVFGEDHEKLAITTERVTAAK
uniref:Cilia- and flagella-associated protein 43 n=1 Tax=Eptatretus burgeri TaxID=7764 RepID=A0A8C4NF30_EPTBU